LIFFKLKQQHSTRSHRVRTRFFFNYKSKRQAEDELTEESATKALFW